MNTATQPPSPELSSKLDAYCRASNYLSVGQIYSLVAHAYVEGHEHDEVHQQLASVLDTVTTEIRQIWHDARSRVIQGRPVWPMIVLRTPKCWTCPAEIDGKKCEDYWRSHQVSMGRMEKPGHVEILETWMKSYRPDELFDASGKFKPEIAGLAPKGERRMSANPHANGGLLLEDLRMPDYRTFAVEVTSPGATNAEATRGMGKFLREVMRLNLPSKNFRIVSPDEVFDAMFTPGQQIIFAFHGYPSLIHKLTYRRTNHRNLHVRGFKEEGTTTTPFDMVVLNEMDRFHLVCDVIDRVPGLVARAANVRQTMVDKRAEHKRYIELFGEDMPEIRNCRWGQSAPAKTTTTAHRGDGPASGGQR